MKITPENTITLCSKVVTVGAIEAILTALRTHGSVYVSVSEFAPPNRLEEVPTLAEVLYGG